MISDGKNDAHSGSESSASDELSQHSTSMVTSATSSPIIAAFTTTANARRNLATTNGNDPHSIVSLASSDGFGLSSDSRSHNLAHFTSPQNAGFFPNGGQLGSHGGLHMMTSPQNYASMPPGSPEHSQGNSTSPPSVGGHPTEANRKRAVRLQKNREAARECRRKKKEYIKCLENRVAVLENQNKALIEELRSLKELYSGKTFGSNHDLNRYNQRLRSCDQD